MGRLSLKMRMWFDQRLEPPTTYIGCDPASDYVGLGIEQPDGKMEMHRRRMGKDLEGSVQRRVWPLLQEVAGRVDGGGVVLALERPPPTARTDTRHGHQAAIGYPIGYVSGLIAARAIQLGFEVVRVNVSPWRDSMLIDAARRGLVLDRPGRKRRRKALGAKSPVRRIDRGAHGERSVLWVGCEHSYRLTPDADLLPQINHLVEAGGCPECRRPATPDEVRDQWKRVACQWAKHRWPDSYRRLVVEARRSARTDRPDHQLAGVPDACEAAGVAHHVRAERGGADV